jgi:hypothetical protein
MLLEKYGLSYRPDLVIVGVLPNDVVDTYFGIDAVRADLTGFLWTREAKELGDVGAMIYRRSHLGPPDPARTLGSQAAPHWNELYKPNGYHEKDWLSMEQEYGRMADLANSIGAKLVLVHIPQKGPWTVESTYLPNRLGAWAATRGVLFVDVLPAMQQNEDPARLYYPKDGHCTPDGYALIAETVYRSLVAQRLVP